MEKTEKSGKYLFQKGFDPRRNLAGRPLGTKNFSTLFEEAIKKIAKEKEITEPEREIVVKAVNEALRGNFNFYKDLMDRNYGKAEESLKLKGDQDSPIRIISTDE